MIRVKTGLALAAALGLSACALQPQYAPKVDLAGHSQVEYDADLDSCQASARQMDVLKGGLIGLVVGAAGGAGIGALTGDAGTGAGIGAFVGATSGAAAGSAYGPVTAARTGTDPDAAFIRDCLARKGYKLLDEAPLASTTGASAAPAK
ncbi:MAG TPA: glycine zipper family protein [Alphaproteobacteria bacterium]|nr:glycine zipper family protein [Alphaproteobacteria bacterium]